MKYNLSMRESQVLHLTAYEYLPTGQSVTSYEIADHVYISHYTAKDHKKSLLKKLHVRNAAGLKRKAFELGS